jgi:hypothetical protein
MRCSYKYEDNYNVFDENALKDDVHTDMKIIMMCLMKML